MVVTVDFTAAETAGERLFDMWNVANRISPKNGANVRAGMKVNTVRMLGGIVHKDKNRKQSKRPNFKFDICTYDQRRQRYVYHFDRLVDRINRIGKGGTQIHQIVLDQPPWCFHRDYKFIPEGKRDGINFRENERVSHYGNSLPPSDKEAWADFIKALMRHLIEVYGKKTVQNWRFRVGSEIETPDHWFGTEKDFIEHFANTVTAIRSVMPDAIVGLHTRPPDFVYVKDKSGNYKGEQIKSFANGIIEYCHDNKIRYDFWGISDYPNIKIAEQRDPKTKYATLFEPLINHPKWLPGTVIDLEEFSVITSMDPLSSSDSVQADTFKVALTDHFYTHGVSQIFQWGNRTDSEPAWPTKVFQGMIGKTRFDAKIKGRKSSAAKHVGAIVAKGASNESIDALLYYYNPADLEANDFQEVNLTLTTEFPVGTRIAFRKVLITGEHHQFSSFMQHRSSSSWLKKGGSKYGNANDSLNDAGKAAWASYRSSSLPSWTKTKFIKTRPTADGRPGSVIVIDTQLPLFSFEKIEMMQLK
ncbi:GH39 family glycosyl hydrolase [Rubripirellula obstinata]|uniref:GH39 family glycosyl hydrolase n=1 Tax=Rubripirellula obstinata TaxID=406547 RepID=UPI0008345DAD|nr:hypothetical protein [Rubripirellula obstinata]